MVSDMAFFVWGFVQRRWAPRDWPSSILDQDGFAPSCPRKHARVGQEPGKEAYICREMKGCCYSLHYLIYVSRPFVQTIHSVCRLARPLNALKFHAIYWQTSRMFHISQSI